MINFFDEFLFLQTENANNKIKTKYIKKIQFLIGGGISWKEGQSKNI